MENLSDLALEVREVGKSLISNTQDIFLMLNLNEDNDIEGESKIRHGLSLVQNILSVLTYLTTLELKKLNQHEELMNEVNKILYTCNDLQSTLSKIVDNGKRTHNNKIYIGKLLTVIKNSANKMITISYLLENVHDERGENNIYSDGNDDICYEDKQTCEQYCSSGFCIEDKEDESNKLDSYCPEYTESFTQSPLTHVESGIEDNENMPWHISKTPLVVYSENGNRQYSIWDVLLKSISSLKFTALDRTKERETTSTYISEETHDQGSLPTSDVSVSEESVMGLVIEDNNLAGKTQDITQLSDCQNKIEHENSFDQEETNYESGTYSETTTMNSALEIDDSPTTVDPLETTTASSYSESATTENYYTTNSNDETTSYTFTEEHTTESPTTPSYETTTQDLYKLSQDIYQTAQDLSSKSSEISSMSSEISSKSSDISSIVSELNNYEDEELSKKIQAVSKLTQEINSKTSEISSLTSTMSSLASDIGSASSDMPSADRQHAFRTTPWQKMSSKSDELITNAQGVVTAAQDILTKVADVISATADLKVAASVANMAAQITAKTQRLISEALGIVSKVIELVTSIDL